jgi:hypothetical protein
MTDPINDRLRYGMANVLQEIVDVGDGVLQTLAQLHVRLPAETVLRRRDVGLALALAWVPSRGPWRWMARTGVPSAW